MTKLSLVNRLEQIRLETEQADDLKEIAHLRVIDVLLDYIGNDEIRKKAEEIPL